MSDEGRERALSHRFWALVLGVPLLATFFVPWQVEGSELYVLEMADAMKHPGWALMPFVGVALLVATFAPMPPLARRGLLAVSGVSALFLGFLLLHAEETLWLLPDPVLAERPAFTLIALMWIVAAGFEMAMHARPRSRGISIAALAGWTLLLLSFAVPLGTHGEWEESIYGSALQEIDRRRFDTKHAFYFGFALLMLVGWLQALRRIGKDRERAAKKRFRTSWIVYLLVPLPCLGLYAIMLWNTFDQPELFTKVHNPWSFVFAATFGGALGIANTTALLAGWKAPRWIYRATAAGFAGAVLIMAIIAVLPDAREGRSAEFVNSIGEAAVLGLRGERVPDRFLGGYEEFDLRAAPAALEGHAPPGAPLRLLATAVRYNVSQPRFRAGGWAVSIDDELRWTGSTDRTNRVTDTDLLGRVDPALEDLIGFAFDESTSCLPALSESARERLGDAFSEESATLDEMLCRSVSDVSIFAADQLRGSVDRYRVVVELPSGEPMTFEGALLFDTRLWVGPPTAMTQ
jgi:hypothetical protein